MAHHKSAIKRIRQNRRKKLYNRLNMKHMREAVKAVKNAENHEEALELYRKATSILDKVTARGVIHKNNAARKKSRLCQHVENLKEA